ncbi:MAG: sigma-70 family RNA polymerase sigma factor [Ruminococcaceae bacterium]|nr:sigma-70 family RNA polymerase sigma factor [Oscillospiraceae bacterium]
MEDEKIIELLFARNQQGLTYTAEKYGSLYKNTLRQALTDPQDVEECANDVLLSIWNTVPPTWPVHYPSYICRIARRIGINRFKFNTREKRNSQCAVLLSELEGCIPARSRAEDRHEAKALQQILNRFLRELEPQTRVLFIRRYFFLESVQDLADRFAVSPNFVSVRLHRARTALRKLLEKEGVEL